MLYPTTRGRLISCMVIMQFGGMSDGLRGLSLIVILQTLCKSVSGASDDLLFHFSSCSLYSSTYVFRDTSTPSASDMSLVLET